MERQYIRKYPRVSASFRVECTVSDQKFHGQASVLGGGGLFLATEQTLAPGTEVLLRFRPAKHMPQIQARAKACYFLPQQGVALEFSEISPEHRLRVLRLIHHKMGDRRKLPRAPLAIQVHCQEEMSLGLSRNVSTGGMFVESKEPLPVGSQLKLRFNLDDEGPVVLAAAEVTYAVTKLGMGIQFTDLAPTDRERVQAYVARSQRALRETS